MLHRITLSPLPPSGSSEYSGGDAGEVPEVSPPVPVTTNLSLFDVTTMGIRADSMNLVLPIRVNELTAANLLPDAVTGISIFLVAGSWIVANTCKSSSTNTRHPSTPRLSAGPLHVRTAFCVPGCEMSERGGRGARRAPSVTCGVIWNESMSPISVLAASLRREQSLFRESARR